MKLTTTCIIIIILFATSPLLAAPLSMSSSVKQATLIELYTSEGCYSCPPADKWLATLKSSEQLWQQYIPVAFHVDYWNYLGWRDPYSKAEYSERQRQYAAQGYAKTVYTPGLFRNGREWRAWFRNRSLGKTASNDVGVLKATLDQHQLNVSFAPISDSAAPLVLNVAVLGFDIVTPVTNGENEGKMLAHDFVALTLGNYKSQRQAGSQGGKLKGNVHQWQISDAAIKLDLPHAKGIALWVTRENDPTPIQATGGWLQ